MELLIDFALREAKNGTVQQTLSRPVNSGLNPAPSSSKRCDSALHPRFAGARMENAGEQLQRRALARSILADDTEGLATADVERYVMKRVKVAMEGAVVEGDEFLQAV